MFCFFAAALCRSTYFCGHSIFSKHTDIPRIPNDHSKRKAMDSDEWEPIRITIDYTQLKEDYKDEYKCTEDMFGKNITWDNESNLTVECTRDKIYTADMISATIGTLENVRKYVESMIKVKRFNGEAQLQPDRDNVGHIPNKTYSGADMYLTVFPRLFPEESPAIAAADFTAQDNETLRPIQGFIIVNHEFAPKVNESIETKSQKAFLSYIHELFHAFGIIDEIMPDWHSHENNEPYGNKYISEIEIGGFKRIVLNSPYSHNFAVKHHGVETFKSGNQEVRSGILLEEVGGMGTKSNHLDLLYYYTELMGGNDLSNEDIAFTRITEASMALLMDTGYYKVDYTKGKPLWWGSKETNKGEYIKDFVTGPPQLTFPSGYLATSKFDPNSDYAGFDYSYVGYYDFTLTTVDELPDEVKNNLDWYNPLNSSFYGNPYFGYQNGVVPLYRCENGTAAINFVGEKATCLKYKIDGNQIEFSSDSLGTVKCTKKDELVKGEDGKTVICPEPEEFTTRIALSQKNTFDSNPFEGVEKYFEKKDQGLEPWVIALIVIGCFVVLAVISIAIFCVTRHKKKDKSSEETP